MSAIAEQVQAPSTQVSVTTSRGEIKVDLAWADKACKRCYGTGKIGTRINMHKGKPTGAREQLLCLCVSREAARRMAERDKS